MDQGVRNYYGGLRYYLVLITLSAWFGSLWGVIDGWQRGESFWVAVGLFALCAIPWMARQIWIGLTPAPWTRRDQIAGQRVAKSLEVTAQQRVLVDDCDFPWFLLDERVHVANLFRSVIDEDDQLWVAYLPLIIDGPVDTSAEWIVRGADR